MSAIIADLLIILVLLAVVFHCSPLSTIAELYLKDSSVPSARVTPMLRRSVDVKQVRSFHIGSLGALPRADTLPLAYSF